MNFGSELKKGLLHGFYNQEERALEHYKPKLIINNPDYGEKVLTSILGELNKCEEFFFSVAFITDTGVTTLYHELMELAEKGVRGKIVASQYQNFSEPKALERLLQLPNIELRIVTEDVAKMHTKGYIFRRGEEYTIIVGSSNLTQSALCQNKEWNLKVSATTEGALLKSTLQEFQHMFAYGTVVNEEWIRQYKEIYDLHKAVRNETKQQIHAHRMNNTTYVGGIKPNKMQVKALMELEKARERKEDKTLIISATGTGKTYLAAFDVKKVQPKRFLFVVHREQIAKAAQISFRKVFGHSRSMAILSGNHRDYEADFIFATIQTLSREHIYRRFDPRTFDYIVIDEVHRAGAKSYKTVMDYFKPQFLLGMSATPERTDGFDIFELFDRNVAFEIRLNDAMKEDMICPFHYFGITDVVLEGEVIGDESSFNLLAADERVAYIKEKMEVYGYSGDRVKGLVFCSRNEEAMLLSKKFNALGYRTVALSGKHSQEERMDAVDRLEMENAEGALDYIFTVDIFNEGVDIPEVNQVVMLRPTQSAIIFVQQLGRGLRKTFEKEYVVILDFIGNYSNNFLIPIALSGDHTYNKDNIRRYVAEGNRVIHGCSTIHFDKITRERIYKAIDHTDFNNLKIIKEAYENLKHRLGRIPYLHEFRKYNVLSIDRILAKEKSYHVFLKKYEKSYGVQLNTLEETFIEFVSKKYVNGKRPHELELIRLLMEGKEDVFKHLTVLMEERYGVQLNANARTNLVHQMTQNFATGSSKNTYKEAVFLEKDGEDYKVTRAFQSCLENPEFLAILQELLALGLEIYDEEYSNTYANTNFVLHEKYTYEDVCRLLDWGKNEVPLNIGGYKFDKETKTFPVFINYHKEEDISESIQYNDHFISPTEMLAYSKSGRTLESEDVKTIYSADELGVEISLFVRKDKNDKTSKEFYYLGKVHAIGEPEQSIMPNTQSNVVKITYKLESPVREDLYDYIIQEV